MPYRPAQWRNRSKRAQIWPRYHQLDVVQAIQEGFILDVPGSYTPIGSTLLVPKLPAPIEEDLSKGILGAREHSDRQNAPIEHDKALLRVMTAVLQDDTELFQQFMDNESFRRWMMDTVFSLTY